MKSVIAFALICGMSVFSFSSIQAQGLPRKGTVGLSAAIQTNQTDLSAPIWVTNSVSIAPMVGIVHEDNNYTNLDVGVKPRFYQHLGDQFATFIGAAGEILFTSHKVGDDTTDYLLGVNGGGEYFLSAHFSLTVEGQLNALFRDSSHNRLATGTAIGGTVYF